MLRRRCGLSEERALRPAVFLDRDGTIAEEVGYLNHETRFRLLPRAAEAIRRLNEAQFTFRCSLASGRSISDAAKDAVVFDIAFDSVTALAELFTGQFIVAVSATGQEDGE